MTDPSPMNLLVQRLLGGLLAMCAAMAQAEVMEELDFRRDGDDAVLQIRLATRVQFVRATTARSGDLVQVVYDLLPARELPVLVNGERRQIQAAGLPGIVIRDEPLWSDPQSVGSRRLLIQLDRPLPCRARAGKGNRMIELVLYGLGPAVKAARQSPARTARTQPPLPSSTVPKALTAAPADSRYAIALSRSYDPSVGLTLPLPSALQNHQLFTAATVANGRTVYEVTLGYFPSQAEAEAAMRELSRFPQARIVRIAPPAPPPAPAATPAPVVAAASSPRPVPSARQPAPVNAAALARPASARDALVAARQAYQNQQFDEAVSVLGELLNQPTSAYTQDAQELIGLARLAQGDPGRARAEFDAYLKLYPSGPGAARVRARLASLERPDAAVPAQQPSEPGEATADPAVVTASVSQYYYGGKSTVAAQLLRDTDGTPLPPDVVATNAEPPITTTDQSLLSSNLDLSWRKRELERDIKLVVRDLYEHNLLGQEQLRGKSRSRNRLSALYLDFKPLSAGLGGRLGRQTAQWGGEGRYDGASTSYAWGSKLKASAMLGVPTDRLGKAQRYFYGAALDADALTSHLGASAFMTQRMIDGEVDRRAVGTDLRFFSQSGSAIATLDYDLSFQTLNVASLQGTYMAEGNTSYNLLLERRTLSQAALGQVLFFQFSDLALMGLQPQTITELKQLTGKDDAQLRELVRANTSYLTHAMTSVSTPVSANWQMGVDVHLNRVGAVAPNEVLPQGQPASDTQWTVGMQAIGSNLYSSRDTHVFAASFITGNNTKSYQLSYNNLSMLADRWQLEPAIRYQRTESTDLNTGMSIRYTAAGPGLKATYQSGKSWVLESSLSIDFTRSTGITQEEKSTRYTYFVGYRYDF